MEECLIFFYLGLSCFSMLFREINYIIFYNILHFTSQKNNKSLNQNAETCFPAMFFFITRKSLVDKLLIVNEKSLFEK